MNEYDVMLLRNYFADNNVYIMIIAYEITADKLICCLLQK